MCDKKQAQTDDNSKEFLLKIRCATVRTFCRNSNEVLDMSSGHATFAQRKIVKNPIGYAERNNGDIAGKEMDIETKKANESKKSFAIVSNKSIYGRDYLNSFLKE